VSPPPPEFRGGGGGFGKIASYRGVGEFSIFRGGEMAVGGGHFSRGGWHND